MLLIEINADNPIIKVIISCVVVDFRQQEVTDEERQRQERLARERIEAARRRRREGKTTPEEAINHETDDRMELQESLNMAVDRRHRHERDLLIQVESITNTGGGVQILLNLLGFCIIFHYGEY